ncbi:MAG: TonB system transport protein ExbD [Beijerinckiaceae bacterium]
MAIKFNPSDAALDETHDINVTPFIDVILVLLIIFMVAAPLSTVDINVDLPTATAEPAPRPDKPLFLTIKADRSLDLGEQPVTRATLASALDTASAGDKTKRIFMRGDKSIPYGDVMEMMNLLRAAGYLKIALVGLDAGPAASAEAAPPPPSGPSPITTSPITTNP